MKERSLNIVPAVGFVNIAVKVINVLKCRSESLAPRSFICMKVMKAIPI